jgi:ComF family protein
VGDKRVMKQIFWFFGKIVEYALPPRCPACGEVVDADHAFCLDCWQSIEFLTDAGCQGCGLPMAQSDLLCGRCIANRPKHDGVRAAVVYGPVARILVLRLKYARRPGHARTIATHLARHLVGLEHALFAPVPLHRWRLWSRGFNQSALIMNALIAGTPRRGLVDLLIRTRRTPVLRGLRADERQQAVKRAFSINPAYLTSVQGQVICLIDDVYTSGATANACAEVLKKAGAARVVVLCWARVLNDRDVAY